MKHYFIIIDDKLYIDNEKIFELPKEFTYGTFEDNIAFVDYLYKNDNLRLLAAKGIDKIYLKSMTKEANFGDDISTLNPEFIGYDGSITNFSTTMMYTTPMGLLMPDYQDKIENDKITGHQYGPSISRAWEFEMPRDNAEWLMQDTRGV